jgi:hypothetical protein
MAQTKARSPAKRAGDSQKSRARSRGSSSRKPASRKSRGASTKRDKSSPNSTARIDSARQTVEHTAKDASQAVGRAASKAKVPLMAGGAALAGAAGGLALGMHQGRRRGGIAAPRRPQVKVNSHDLARAAKEVGTFGAQMGHLASELQRNREAANGGSKHRSPLEVVLEGLTARRSRA